MCCRRSKAWCRRQDGEHGFNLQRRPRRRHAPARACRSGLPLRHWPPALLSRACTAERRRDGAQLLREGDAEEGTDESLTSLATPCGGGSFRDASRRPSFGASLSPPRCRLALTRPCAHAGTLTPPTPRPSSSAPHPAAAPSGASSLTMVPLPMVPLPVAPGHHHSSRHFHQFEKLVAYNHLNPVYLILCDLPATQHDRLSK